MIAMASAVQNWAEILRTQNLAADRAMDGANTFLSKLVGIFVDMDRMIGQDFETGLANLKAAAEK